MAWQLSQGLSKLTVDFQTYIVRQSEFCPNKDPANIITSLQGCKINDRLLVQIVKSRLRIQVVPKI